MAVGSRKTRDFKNRQCQQCKHADKAKLRQGRPCCPFSNPQIRNGHCVEFEPAKPKKEKVSA